MRGILIAVDFGTTFTGVAYSDPSGGNDPILFTSWPGGNADKIPTIVRRQPDMRSPAWGNLVKSGHQRYEWFKLGLEPMRQAASSSIDMSVKYPTENYPGSHQVADARVLTTYFLTQVRKHVIKTLRNRYGPPAFDALEVQWMVTVPAIWSLEAKNLTKECAEKAGMGAKDSLKMISEPEAAAVYAIKRLEPHHLQIGNNIVVLDAGGGTVDLITYKITQLSPRLKVEESSTCTGGKCGGVFVNRIFEAMVDAKIAGAGVTMPDAARSVMRKHFETFTKKQFDLDEDDAEYIPVPGVSDCSSADIRGGRLAVTADQLRPIFDEVISNVNQLTVAQVQGITGPGDGRQVSAIVVVGGFGESQYLQQSVRAVPALAGIPILPAPNAWTAVVRGAATGGYTVGTRAPQVVQSRLSQCSIGLLRHGDWKPEHGEGMKYWCPIKGEWRSRDMFDVVVRRHDQLKEKTPVRLEAYVHFRAKDSELSKLVFEEYVYTCFAETPPTFCDETCTYLGVLTTELSSLPLEGLKKVKGKDGKWYWLIEWTTEITFGSASMKFEIEFNGKKYNSIDLDYQGGGNNGALERALARTRLNDEADEPTLNFV